jgi:hypothetical protein
VTLSRLWDHGRRPSWEYAELYDDGAGFACTRIPDARGSDHADIWINNEALIWSIGRCLHLLGRHAVHNCGAWGDAVVEARLVSESPMQLAYLHRLGGTESAQQIDRGRELQEAASKHTFVVEAAATPSAAFAVATRLLATDLFHAFGSPEVRQIDSWGALRVRYLGNAGLRAWADGHGIPLSEGVVPGE